MKTVAKRSEMTGHCGTARTLLSFLFFTIWYKVFTCTVSVSGHALTYTVAKRTTKCIHLNYMGTDTETLDMIFIPLSVDEDQEVEDYYAKFLSKYESYSYPRIPSSHEIPIDIQEKAKNYGKEERKLRVDIVVFEPDDERLRVRNSYSLPMTYHKPSIRKVVKFISNIDVCFANNSFQKVQMLFGVYNFDDDMQEYSQGMERADIITKDHLLPINKSLKQLQRTGNKINRQFSNSSNKERKIKKTTDSINHRVRLFSYLSVFLLLGTAMGQFFFFRYYFQKKKLIKKY